MNPDSDEKNGQIEIMKLKIAYWHKRLDHTLQHTQTATKLIYLADGAVIGFCYFWIKALGVNRLSIGTASLPIFLLAIMNYFHAGLLGNQQSWYGGIDAQLRNLLAQPTVDHQKTWLSFLFPKSSHKTFQAIHLAIFIALLFAGFLMLLYGFGYFPEIKKT